MLLRILQSLSVLSVVCCSLTIHPGVYVRNTCIHQATSRNLQTHTKSQQMHTHIYTQQAIYATFLWLILSFVSLASVAKQKCDKSPQNLSLVPRVQIFQSSLVIQFPAVILQRNQVCHGTVKLLPVTVFQPTCSSTLFATYKLIRSD